MGKISNYARVLVSKLTDVFVVDQTDNGTTETKSATVEQIGTAIGTLQNFADLDTSNKTLVDAINEIASYTPVYGNTASGAIANFDTSLALPLQDCTIGINAVQESGTPTPSSPKAISGFTGANIRVVGSNLTDEQWELGTIDGTTGANVAGSSSLRTTNYIPIEPNTTYYFYIGGSSSTNPYLYDQNKQYIGRLGSYIKNQTFTTPSNTYYIRLGLQTGYGTTYNNDISINYPATDTTYHAYNADSTTYPITWQTEAGTVYGGSLDVTSGKLTLTHALTTLDGSQGSGSFRVSAKTGYTQTEWFDYRSIGIIGAIIISDKFFSTDEIPTVLYGVGGSPNGERCFFGLPDTVTTPAEANTWFENNPTVIVYPIATPQTYQLTPTQISAIVGTNNVFTDTNGNTSVVYACSLKDYIDSQ